MMNQKNKAKLRKPLLFLLAAVVVAVTACAIYLADFYPADAEAIAAFSVDNTVEMRAAESGDLIWEPEGATQGLIFYPGGKVEHTAYIPLMNELSSRGILCVVVEMPFHLAVLDINGAEGIREQFPQIEGWYIGGHSLGGSMAAAYLAACADAFEGLILLGSYSATDLSATDLAVLSVYGSEDMVMNREKYEESRGNLPKNVQELVIDGGCHAYFGMYGPQDGDGTPAITNEAQIVICADAIEGWMERQAALE